MKKIPLTQNQEASVDDDKFEILSKFKWYAFWDSSTKGFYAARTHRDSSGRTVRIRMHREIVGIPVGDPRLIDHINHDTLDNRIENLRPASVQENARNCRVYSTNSSGHKGVSQVRTSGKWKAYIMDKTSKLIHLGCFDTLDKAVEVRKAAEYLYYGAFASRGV